MLRGIDLQISKGSESIVLAPRDLTKKEHGEVICYPGIDLLSFRFQNFANEETWSREHYF